MKKYFENVSDFKFDTLLSFEQVEKENQDKEGREENDILEYLEGLKWKNKNT